MSRLIKLSFSFLRNTKQFSIIPIRPCSANKSAEQSGTPKFETVFSFPTIRYMALINRLKVYQLAATALFVPCTGALSMMNVLAADSFYASCYIGITGAAVMSIATLPFRNIIGHIYISEDNKHIKIASLDYWGRRHDRIVNTEEWIPLLEMPPKTSDAIYLTPQLTDGTRYKLLVRYGKVINAKKMGQVLE